MAKPKFTESPDRVIIIGTSAGGIHTLKALLGNLTPDYRFPIVIVIHRLKNVRSHLVQVLQSFCKMIVKEAEEKEVMRGGTIYVAPSNYHLLLEHDLSFSLTVDEAVNFSRPSIDISFISFGEILKEKLIGIILTGANADGSRGLLSMHQNGSLAWVQHPDDAYVSSMPRSALQLVPDAKALTIKEIERELQKLSL